MLNNANHLELARCVLQGSKDANLILADLLEEMGDRANAQFARSHKKSLRKRFDLTVGMLPVPVVLWLTCDFVQHAVGAQDYLGVGFAVLAQSLRDWSRDQLKSPDCKTGYQTNLEYMFGQLQVLSATIPRQSRHRHHHQQQMAFSRALLSVVHVGRAAWRITVDGREGEMASKTAVGSTAKAAASSARTVASITRNVRSADRQSWEQELHWQAARVDELIKALLT